MRSFAERLLLRNGLFLDTEEQHELRTLLGYCVRDSDVEYLESLTFHEKSRA